MTTIRTVIEFAVGLLKLRQYYATAKQLQRVERILYLQMIELRRYRRMIERLEKQPRR